MSRTDATVLINPFTWGYGLYAGNDGGFWISPLAGRKDPAAASIVWHGRQLGKPP